MIRVVGVFGARTTAGDGTYTKSGGTMIVEISEVQVNFWGKGFGEMKWKSLNRRRSKGFISEKRVVF